MKILVIISVVTSCVFADAYQRRGQITEEDAIRFIQKGHNVKLAKDAEGKTPMHFAGQNGWETFARLLIVKGYTNQIHSRDKNGDTPLSLAAKGMKTSPGHENVAKLLIENGANINNKNIFQKTPLHLAVISCNEKIVELLHGADKHIRDYEGKMPYDYAVENSKTFDLIEEEWIIEMLGAANQLAYTPYVSQSQNAINQACKVFKKLPSDFIINGERAAKGEFPWMASLGYFNARSIVEYKCGGTIISKHYILTAAHCAKLEEPPIVVRLGKINLSDDDASNYHIQGIIRHEHYSGKTKKNDIALIRVVKDILFTSDVRPACLETDLQDLDPNVRLYVSGFGITSTKKTVVSNDLLKAKVSTVPLSHCNETYLKYISDDYAVLGSGLSVSQYCANDPISDTCQGDSGGPLQVFRNNNTAHVVGIVSFGISCGIGLPSVYTRVAYYSEWIAAHVWPNA